LNFEITAANAMGLSKGKTKVANIGKSSAEKMKEFCETGTMTKLVEKRADNA
jgi:DNA polymerase/3'-5' exonuclease PolX